MPVKIDTRKLSRYAFPLVKYTLTAHPEYGLVNNKPEPYIVTIEHDTRTMVTDRRGYTSKHTQRFFAIMTGGKGDKVCAVFHQNTCDPDVWNLLKSLCNFDADPSTFGPLCDRLQETDHWITPLLRKWWAKASIAPNVRELTPIKKKLWED